MALIEGVDYAFSPHPSKAALKAAGKKFVVRYIGSKDYTKSRSDKWLNPTEYKALTSAGLAVAVVFETGAQRAESGRAAGTADAKVAIKELAYCGLPADMPVYFAVDYDTTVGPNVTGYFQGVASVLGLGRTGCYAGYKVIKVLLDKKLIAWAWQTYAWSGGQWDKRAQLQQYANGKSLGGADVDYTRATVTSYGQAGAAPVPPNPGPKPKAWPKTYYRVTSPLMHGTNVTWIQERLNAHGAKPVLKGDGEYGTKTQDAVEVFQKAHGLTKDGVVGKITWTTLGK